MITQTSPVVKATISQREGCARKRPDGRFDAYPDPASLMGCKKYPIDGPDVSKGAPWTIGFGATGAGITRGTIWTLDQCEQQLDQRLTTLCGRVAHLIGQAATTQNQFDAMVMLADNIGIGNFEASSVLRDHIAGHYDTAADDFGKWVFAQGVKLPGLVTRRAAEAALYAKPAP